MTQIMNYPTQDDAADSMIQAARQFYQWKWLMGTSGNLSVRISPKTFLITASGKDKGNLTPEDFLLCTLDGDPVHSTHLRPSAETLIHCELYTHFPNAGAVYHTHEPFAALCSARDARPQGHTEFKALEMIKGLGNWEQDARVRVPILDNWADLNRVAQDLRALLNARAVEVPAVNLVRHGAYVWGEDAFAAKRHMESLGYLFEQSWRWGQHTP